MKKIILAVVSAILLFSCFPAAKAGVTFLPNSSAGVGSSGNNNNLSNAQRCINEGYSYTKCEDNQHLAIPCPYDRSYYQNCCSDEYLYTQEECTEAGLRYSRNSCGGFYKCL